MREGGGLGAGGGPTRRETRCVEGRLLLRMSRLTFYGQEREQEESPGKAVSHCSQRSGWEEKRTTILTLRDGRGQVTEVAGIRAYAVDDPHDLGMADVEREVFQLRPQTPPAAD